MYVGVVWCGVCVSLANCKGSSYFWYLPNHPPFSITTLLFQTGFLEPFSYQSTLKPGSYLNSFVFFLMLPWWFSNKESACSAGDAKDVGSIPGLGWSPGVGNDMIFCLFVCFLLFLIVIRGKMFALQRHTDTHILKSPFENLPVLYTIVYLDVFLYSILSLKKC